MTASLTEIHVPADDGAVQRAFERLDAQMDAWLAAMKRLDAHLQTAEAVQPVLPIVSPTVSDDQALEVKSTHEVSAQIAQVTQAKQSAVKKQSAVQQSEPVIQVARTEPVAAAEANAEPAGAVTVSPAELDGDALLATLDEETAKDIRVMRRMTFGKRSVRELLAEYQAKKAGQKTGEQTGKSKSWWRR